MPDDATGESGSAAIDAVVADLGDWRGELLARIRELIAQAEPDVVEEVKWRKPSNPLGVPTWSLDGLICTGETYKAKVKLTFAKGRARGPGRPLQREPRRGHAAGDRPARGRHDRPRPSRR